MSANVKQATKATFEDLIARREQREADKMKVGTLTIPGTDIFLEARMPSQKSILSLYGELSSSGTALAALECGKHALYDACPMLQDTELQVQLGVEKDPMSILDALFSIAEQDNLGGQALRFMGLLPQEDADPEKTEDDAGLETVKN